MTKKLGLLIALSLASLGSEAARLRAGEVDQVQGNVELLRPGQKAVALKAKDKGLVLYIGDKVKCAGTAKLVMKSRAGIDVPLTGSGWTAIPLVRTVAEIEVWRLLTGGKDRNSAAVRAAVKPKNGTRPVIADAGLTPISQVTVLLPDGLKRKTTTLTAYVWNATEMRMEKVFGPVSVPTDRPYESIELREALRSKRGSGLFQFEVSILGDAGEELRSGPTAVMPAASEDRLAADLKARIAGMDDYGQLLARARFLEEKGLVRLMQVALWKLWELES